METDVMLARQRRDARYAAAVGLSVPAPSPAVFVGVDIGQRIDPTAIAVVSPETRTVDGRPETHYLARHLERMQLDTPYPAVVDRVYQITDRLARTYGAGDVRVYIDATGVGQPVVDLLRPHVPHLVACYFTHGDRRIANPDGSLTLGKCWLVSHLQVLLQTRRLHIPAEIPDRNAITNELQTYEIRVSANANDTYGAFATGAHDDQVTALGLACLDAPPSGIPPSGGQRRTTMRDVEL